MYHKFLLRFIFIISFSLCTGLTLPTKVAAANTDSTASNVRLLGHIGGSIQAVYVTGSLTYVGEGSSLVILDTSQPNHSRVVGRAELTEEITDIMVQAKVAYVAAGAAGLQIFDVATPSKPFRVAAFATPGTAYSIYISGNIAYIATGTAGLRLVSVANPASPIELGFYAIQGIAYSADVYVSDNIAYVTAGATGLHLINVANPVTPTELGLFASQGNSYSAVFVSGNVAYVTAYDAGLRLINVIDPTAPTEIGFYNQAGDYATSVYVSGNIAYVTNDGIAGLRLVNVENPTSPTSLGFYTAPGFAGDVYVSGDIAYIAAFSGGLRLVSVVNPAAPVELGFYNSLGAFAENVFVSGNIAYVADGYAGLRIVNIADPAAPVAIGFYNPSGGDARGVYVLGNIAYIAYNALGLRLVNVANPMTPMELGSYNPPGGSVTSVYVSGTTAYVTARDAGLRLVNVTNPAAPTELGSYSPPGQSFSAVYVSGNIAYVAAGLAGLRLINIENPAAPTEVGSYDTPGSTNGVYVLGTTAYVADNAGLWVLKVTNPAAPTEIGFYNLAGESAYGIYVSDNIAYVTELTRLSLVNVANPAALAEVGFYDSLSNVGNVYVSDGKIYLASTDAGLYILRYPACYRLTLGFTGQGGLPTPNLASSPGCLGSEYLIGASVTLSAQPAPTWRVAGWQGTSNDSSTQTVNQFVMPAADYNVTVNYAPTCYTLNLTHSGSGANLSLTPPNSAGCDLGQFVVQQPITLTAAPGTGNRVGSWSGTANDGSTDNQNGLVMPANNTTVGVNYILACYRLTLFHTGSGSDPNATPPASDGCEAGQYHYNAQLALNASPAQGWQVSAWSGTTNNTFTITTNSLIIPAADYSAGVHYGEVPVVTPGDLYELDDTCSRSRAITTDGSEVQQHTFHKAGDVDWIRFDATAGTRYRVEVTVPDTSPADVVLEPYRDCASAPDPAQAPGFNPGARIDISRTVSGPTYLSIYNEKTAVAGSNVTYEVAVHKLGAAPQNRALLIVAGRLKLNDEVQANIDNVAKKVYKLFQRNGYTADNTAVLANNPTLPGYTGAATHDALQAAITQWAAAKVTNGVFTLYMVDHGTPERFYLDGVTNQQVTPSELNDWLTQLEKAAPGVKINVIIEACESGSFIDLPTTLSRNGRIVLTSSNASEDAKASKDGAYFSDHLLTWLQQGYNLSASFAEARAAAKEIYLFQDAWLDGDGDGLANEFDDAAAAAQRSFTYAGTLPGDEWPPHIFSAAPLTAVSNGSVRLRADVRDDAAVRQVWVVVYPPDYTPPPASQQLLPEVLPTFLFTRVDNDNHWEAEITGLQKSGVYRLLVHAEDDAGLVARPLRAEVNTAAINQVYLPILRR